MKGAQSTRGAACPQRWGEQSGAVPAGTAQPPLPCRCVATMMHLTHGGYQKRPCHGRLRHVEILKLTLSTTAFSIKHLSPIINYDREAKICKKEVNFSIDEGLEVDHCFIIK
ncbi:hypothetical protein [Herbaspirillum sp. AP21]|uniref:hypothetical protein n=1 Tax=Herbaspirillum sp. AP21 TaxID=2754073 RepID=UPI0015DA0081|nr:hypothetical protein [Herbaspirillum sp. AP21]NZD67041.1 hypothetical protein [Herbaspirillum sp. AP21]